MARLLRIERAIRWMAKTLTANRDALPFPEGITNVINPTIEIFGSQRMGEVEIETVLGGSGVIEVAHTRVPAERIRYYLAMEFSMDDPTDRRLRPGRTFTVAAGFPFVGMEDERLAAAGEFFAVRNFTVPPLGRAAVQANALTGGTQMTVSFVWIEMPLGEYVHSIR